VSATGAHDLTQGPVTKTLIAFALPSLAVNILQTLNGTVSAIFVGKMIGPAALAATANANMVLFAIFSLVMGFAMAATILVGQAVGRQDWQEVKKITGASMSLFMLSSFAIAALGWFTTPWLVDKLEVPAEVVPLAIDYLRVVMFGVPVSMVTMLMPALLRGIGDSLSPLINMAINVALCVVLNPLFIPWLGLKGAAIAGISANLICGIIQLIVIYAQKMPLALKGSDLRLLVPDRARAAPLVRMGIPLSLSMVVMGVSQLIVIGLINREGMATVAGFGAVNQLWSFLQMPAFAVSIAVSAMAAQNIGAGLWGRLGQITFAGTLINVVMTSSILIAMTLAETQLLGLFLPAGSEAIAIGARINLLVGWTYIAMCIGSVVGSVVRASGDTIMPMWIQIISGVLIRFAIAFPLYPIWGANAIWASFAGAAVSSTLMGLAYYRWGKWRDRKPLGGAILTPDPNLA
jgi:putative MATE family efflux protein